MPSYHISGRPPPLRVFGTLDPSEPLPPLARSGTTARSRMVTQVMPAVGAPDPHERRRWLVPGLAGVGVLAAVTVAVFLRAPPVQEQRPATVAAPVKPARSSFFSPSRPVLAQKSWEYGRVGTSPRQTLPSPAALEAYRNEMEKLPEKQKALLSSLPAGK